MSKALPWLPDLSPVYSKDFLAFGDSGYEAYRRQAPMDLTAGSDWIILILELFLVAFSWFTS
jgi:hypothetical protein